MIIQGDKLKVMKSIERVDALGEERWLGSMEVCHCISLSRLIWKYAVSSNDQYLLPVNDRKKSSLCR